MTREKIVDQYISMYEGVAMEKEELEIMLNRFADDITRINQQEGVEAYCVKSYSPCTEFSYRTMKGIELIYEEKEGFPIVKAGDKIIIKIEKP